MDTDIEGDTDTASAVRMDEAPTKPDESGQTKEPGELGDDGVWHGCRVHHYAYDWQARQESAEQRQALLEGIRIAITTRATAHLAAGEESVLVLATPPGTGKSTAVAALGEPGGKYGLNLAWIAERHDMAEQVPALQHYNHIERCTAQNCPDGYRTHAALLERGLPTFWLHQQHAQPCEYLRQFHQDTSAFYQLAHVRTAHPAKHPDGIVIDELNLEAWLEPYEVTRSRILEARASFGEESAAWRLLTAALDAMHEATVAPTSVRQECSGRTLFAALDAHLGGELLAVLEELCSTPDATILYPQPLIPLNAPDAAERLHDQPTRVLAHLWHGLAAEMSHYRNGDVAWNSRLRVGPGQNKKGDWVLYITTPRSFKVADDAQLPPRIVLDGTADLELLHCLLGTSLTENLRIRVPEELPPPPGMRHIAVRLRTRTGGIKRYSKSSLVGPSHAAERTRLIADLQAVLERLDADRAFRAAGRVGLITFQSIEAEVREALSIPETRSGHFWAVRGSNRFTDCDILLVVGRPALSSEDIFRMGSVLYAQDKDAEPLMPGMTQAQDKTYHYRDARLEHLTSSLTRAELAQCAHRNRPLIFDHRTVVTFCDEPISFLPITTEVQTLPAHRASAGGSGQAPALSEEVSGEEKLEHAAALLKEQGRKQTVAALLDALRELYGSGLNRQKVTSWHKMHPPHSPHSPQAA